MWLVPYNSKSTVPNFHSMLDGFFNDFGTEKTLNQTGGNSFSPRLDIKEAEEAYHISVEVPGVDKEGVDISLKDGLLTIQGERKQEAQEENEKYSWIERSYGSFQRSVRLPKHTQEDAVEARLENGVLEIKVPKMEQPKPKKITVS